MFGSFLPQRAGRQGSGVIPSDSSRAPTLPAGRLATAANALRHKADPRLRYLAPKEQAARFLRALQVEWPNGAKLAVSEVMNLYAEWTLEQQVTPASWMAVAKHFRQLCGCGRFFASDRGRRYMAYVIPASVAGGFVTGAAA